METETLAETFQNTLEGSEAQALPEPEARADDKAGRYLVLLDLKYTTVLYK